MTETIADRLAGLMTQGGDARIVLDPASGLNRYHSAPRPTENVLAFASSTANDIGHDAMAHLIARHPDGGGSLVSDAAYDACLDDLRARIREAYALDPDTDVLFAPSGTDLEYVGLLAVAARRRGGIVNLLLGADEVGSGCIHSADGRFFAHETALGLPATPGEPVAGLPAIKLADQPVRDGDGAARTSAAILAAMVRTVEDAIEQDRSPVIHVVHGSKTGLVLPRLEHIDALRDRFGDEVTFVVDACQARITSAAVQAFLRRGMIVFLTGSKFMGGPPFSGFALLPPGIAARAAPPAAGMARIFRRAEFPQAWPGRDRLPAGGNPGLALRLSASLFELARFQRIAPERLASAILAFDAATDTLAAAIGARKIRGGSADGLRAIDHPAEMLTLTTLDLSHCRQDGTVLTFDDATGIHRDLIADGIRLGQPVRCVRIADGPQAGAWGATLRVGLSMPQVAMLDAMEVDAARGWLDAAMTRIADALHARLVGTIPTATPPAPGSVSCA